MLPGASVEAEQRLGLGPACLLKEEAFKALNLYGDWEHFWFWATPGVAQGSLLGG